MDTLTNWDPNHYSWLERKFLKLLSEARIQGFQHNYKVEIPDKGKEFYIDFASPTLMLGFEIDSKAFHSSAAAKSHDERLTIESRRNHSVADQAGLLKCLRFLARRNRD